MHVPSAGLSGNTSGLKLLLHAKTAQDDADNVFEVTLLPGKGKNKATGLCQYIHPSDSPASLTKSWLLFHKWYRVLMVSLFLSFFWCSTCPFFSCMALDLFSSLWLSHFLSWIPHCGSLLVKSRLFNGIFFTSQAPLMAGPSYPHSMWPVACLVMCWS